MTDGVLPTDIDKDTITIDSVFVEMEHWRKNKSSYPSKNIPDDIWLKCFILEEKHSGKKIRTIFALNAGQYRKKYQQLVGSHGNASNKSKIPSKTDAEKDRAIDNLCEIKVEYAAATNMESPPPLTTEYATTRRDLSKLKSTKTDPSDYLMPTTVIVECIRADGNRLKIHATNKSIKEVMSCFYHSGEVQQ